MIFYYLAQIFGRRVSRLRDNYGSADIYLFLGRYIAVPVKY